ncbi:unnamed protein product [Adineta steineri]|uniref:RZ-type domain-containing protein n=1 Tax=Adineta steineri TaxID=433720 RepID=A0A814X875_9BILA|nr:unnamed protein product [Adineta steineri]
MSNARDRHGMKSNSSQHQDRWNGYHHTTSSNRYSENQNHYSSNKRHYNDKHESTTRLDSPPNKRLRLPPVSYPTLTKLIDKTPDEILAEMLHPNFQLNKFLNDKRMQERFDWMNHMTILLEKITKCIGSNEQLRTVFEELPRTLYLEGIYDKIRDVDPTTKQLRFNFIELFLKISNTFLVMMPNSVDAVTKIFERLAFHFSQNQSESPEFQSIKKLLDEVLEEVKKIEQRKQLKQELRNAHFVNTTDTTTAIQSSDAYRKLPIVPSLTEILSEQKPNLRGNIVNGTYESPEQYLDIHFRLLREDFVGPLRDGIQQYISKLPGKNSNLRIYENVRLLGSKLNRQNELVYEILLDSTTASRIHWANGRRLIYGNLLVIPYNNFQSCAFFTVEDRSQIEKNFIISVKSLNNSQADEIDRSCSSTMLETMVFFEAYRPVLNALQIIPSDHRFPLGEFLLKVTNERIPPDYMTPTTTYDFTPLLVHPESEVKANLITRETYSTPHKNPKKLIKSVTVRGFKIDYRQSNQIEEKYKKVSVVNQDEWPTSEQLHLNPKQREALILALTNKVALIQGPPGTGKTFLGVRITEMLLHNRSVWCPYDVQPTPILMICHTNHALDQFLELIVDRLNIDKGIIRVGSRCQNPKIQQFSLYNARQIARENRSLPKDVYHGKRTILERKFQTEECLKSFQRKLELSQTDIVPLSSFLDKSIIDDRHLKSLLGRYKGEKVDIALVDWLGFFGEYEQTRNDFTNKGNLKTENVVPMEINDEDELNEEEEEEEERRRDELDMEEYDHFSTSAVSKSQANTVNHMDIESKSTNSTHIRRFIQFIDQNPITLTDETVKLIDHDVWKLSNLERYNLYGYWLLKYRQRLHHSVHNASLDYNHTVSDLAKCRQEADCHILKDSIIIAMTTTCAAKYHKTLENLQSKIVIVEEAAAIFEAHIITALSTKCEHLILIGDHVQLRPNPSVYQLGIKYKIDVSLFERLINNNFPNVRLNIQHRMRPEIARIMKYFYDDLEDHISVKIDRESVRGVDNNVFFIKHNNHETNVDDGHSKRNEYEAKYVIEFAEYLIKQGYTPKQITILVMYLGQKQFIAKLAKQGNLLRGVRIMVTDNYQGEENDIIILSLVRSNPENKIGFLNIHNRICVALSRARCGLFVIGNMDLLADVDDMWKNIVSSLTETKEIGRGLSLSCRQHPEPKFLADKPESFAQRPEGGCQKKCNARLKCGHDCQLKCHNNDLEHDEITCKRRCNEKFSCGHSCARRCHFETPDQHDPCNVLVEKTVSECGHSILIECCKTPTNSNCKKSSLKQLSCGHTAHVPCRIITLPNELKQFSCEEPCGSILACKHKCVGTCGDCHTGKLHVPCGEKCERNLICSHVCKVSCATNCPPCSRQCETRCIHSRCKNTCGSPCPPCRRLCGYKCKHLQCTRLCSEPCDRGPCNEPCNKKLKCGHTCIGLCGEKCPPQCRICDKDIVQDVFFGTEEEPDARFILLPDCNHIIEVTALDKYVNVFVNDSDDKTAIRFPECPRCRRQIHYCTRYMSIINEVHKLITQVKKKILGHSTEEERRNRQKNLINEYEKMKKNLKETHLDTSMKIWFSILNKPMKSFTDDVLNLITNIIEFLNEIDKILMEGRNKLRRNIFEDKVYFPLYHIIKYLFTQRQHRNFAEQQLKDIQSEFKRIDRVIYIEALIFSLEQTLTEDEKEGLDAMEHLINKPGPFTDDDRQKFDDLVKKFQYLNNLPGLGITDNERKAIISALNMKQGHWYTCPNGHPYVITECGGANQESHCNECGERIGGQNHRLVETNSHFALMDGSQHAAWSNEANLN